MKTFYTNFVSTILFCLTVTASLFANNGGNDRYIDYLPKYRTLSTETNYQIDKIEYQNNRTVFHFRYVAEQTGQLDLHQHNTWQLRTPDRLRKLQVQFNLLEVRNLRIAEKVQAENLNHTEQQNCKVNKGDLITYEIHFPLIPRYIQVLDLVSNTADDFDCLDIMIKSKDNPALGSMNENERVVTHFNQQYNYVATQTTNSNEAPRLQKRPKYQNLVNQKDFEPIDYTPQNLNSIEDLNCSVRALLPDVKFKDNQSSFEGRVEAIKNIRLVADYLTEFPEAKVCLHGHTDVFGNPWKNLKLSRERAVAVKLELVKMGIRADRIEVRSYGGVHPLAGLENGSEQNRRVEVEPICD